MERAHHAGAQHNRPSPMPRPLDYTPGALQRKPRTFIRATRSRWAGTPPTNSTFCGAGSPYDGVDYPSTTQASTTSSSSSSADNWMNSRAGWKPNGNITVARRNGKDGTSVVTNWDAAR